MTQSGGDGAARPPAEVPVQPPPAAPDADISTAVLEDHLTERERTDLAEAERARSLRERLVPPMPTDRAAAWVWALVITTLAGILRFWNLGNPPQIVFDETYYAKDSYSLLRFGYERAVVKVADGETPIDAQILAGRTDIFEAGPSYVVHPPAGKWMIAMGEGIFGLDPFGWRFSVALFGTLTVTMLFFVARRLFRSTLLGGVAALLLALDGLAIVMSRTALLDGLLAFWLVAAFGCLLVDRDHGRSKLLDRYELARATGDLSPGGPRVGVRWWRIAAGVCFGLACGTKWSGVYVLAACGILVVLWDVAARKAIGVRRPYAAGIIYDGVPAFFSMVGVAIVGYLATWTGWFLSSNGHDRQWVATQLEPNAVMPFFGRLPGWLDWLAPDALRSLWHYHGAMLGFHSGLNVEDSPHPYAATAWRWLQLGRPTQFEFTSFEASTTDLPSGIAAGTTPEELCGAARCARDIIGMGTPAIWWAGCIALVALLVLWVGRRDWRAGAVLALVGSTWLPWLAFSNRPIFFFYAVAIVPFLILAVTLVLGYLLGPPGADAQRRRWGAIVVGVYLLLVVINTAYFYPVFTGEWIPYDQYSARMWFRFWV